MQPSLQTAALARGSAESPERSDLELHPLCPKPKGPGQRQRRGTRLPQPLNQQPQGRDEGDDSKSQAAGDLRSY